jgi:imidazolonepropionase-like amidohydrolase
MLCYRESMNVPPAIPRTLLAILALAGAWFPCLAATIGNATPIPVTVIQAGTLLLDPREPPRREQSIVVENGRISEVRPGFVSVPGARVIDLRTSFVLPGLIDLHVHLTSNPVPGGELKVVTAGSADLALLATDNARRTLAAGFTTVVDLGTGRRAHEDAIYALRDAIATGIADGPRILTAGSPLSAPGSSRTGRFRPEVEAIVGPEAVCSGADDCRRAVREQVRRGADVISFYNTGSLLSIPSPPQTFTDEEMRAIVGAAHALGRRVIADGGNTRGNAQGINAALRAGADIIDTGTYPDAATWTLLKERAAYYVPHLYALRAAVGDSPRTLDTGTMGWLPQPVLAFLFELKQQQPAAIDAHRTGVQLAFGSDPGVFLHGDNAREFIEYVTVVGLTAAQAIATATVNAAQALGLETEIGTLAAGRAADLIATAASPVEDITELTRVRFVMRGGRIFLSP